MALSGNAAGFPIVSNAQRGEGGSQRGGGGSEALGRWCPFSAWPYESSLLLSKSYNCTFLIFCPVLLTVVID